MQSFGGRLFVVCVIVLIVAAGVSVSVLGQPAPRAGCEWEYDLELQEGYVSPSPTLRRITHGDAYTLSDCDAQASAAAA